MQKSSSFLESEQFKNTLVISFAFFLIFFGFSSAQIFQTTKSSNSNAGAVTLSILYVSFVFSTSFASVAVRKLGIRLSLCLAPLGYVIFIGSNLFSLPVFWYIGGALDGIAAAILWTAQGGYLTQTATDYEIEHNLVSDSTQGTFNGIFFGIFQGARLISNFCVAVLFEEHVSMTMVFTVLAASASLGWLLMFFVKMPKTQNLNYTTQNSSIPLEDTEVKVQVEVPELKQVEEIVIVQQPRFENFKLLLEPKMALLMPITFYQGIALGFVFGVVPALISDRATRFFIMSIFSIANMVSCLLTGRLSDRVGRLPVLYAGGLIQLIAFGMILSKSVSEKNIASFVLMAILVGFGDGSWNTQPSAILGIFYKQNPIPAFANYRLFQAAGVAVAFAYYPFVSTEGKALICIGMLTVGILCLQFLHYFVESISSKKLET